MLRWTPLLFLLAVLFHPRPACAGDAVTLLFREGQVVYLDYGYKAIAEAFKRNGGKDGGQNVLELSIEGGSFLLDLSQIVVVCRDRCSAMTISDPRSKKDRE